LLYVPSGGNDFSWQLSSEAGVRPVAAYGTQVTPGNNAKGAWAEVFTGAEVANDVYGVLIRANSNAVAAAIRDAIMDVGTDPAGGTSYAVVIPDLLVSAAAPLVGVLGSGISYYFPLFIRAGSSIACRASVNNATVGTLRAWLTILGQPRRPDMVVAGTYVHAFGIVAASSRGTIVTPGTTAEGAWTSLGTTAHDHWWWQMGMGIADTTFGTVTYFMDLAAGDVTNKRVLMEDQVVTVDGSERLVTFSAPGTNEAIVASGKELWGRAQCSAAADTNVSLAAYGLGG
jgi:hypothetical protein